MEHFRNGVPVDVEENQSVDFWLLFSAVILAGVGLVMVYSSSMYFSMDRVGDGMYFFKKQAFRLLISLSVMMFLTKVNYRGFARLSSPLLIFGFVLLIMLLIQKAATGKGVERWLRLGFVSFQPSEIMKLFIIIYLAAAIARLGEHVREFKRGFVPLMSVLAITFLLVVVEPDLGTAGLIMIVGFGVLFLGRAKIAHLLVITLPAFLVVSIIALTVPYMQNRITMFLNDAGGYQVKQSIIGIGSGGLFGMGLGNSVQKYYFLPERHTDFVFAIFAEEVGLIGTTLLLLVLFLYVYRGFKIAEQAPDTFGFLLASGLSMLVGAQVFINIGVATRVLPTTGMTLPFISYGGSSLLLSFIATGILLNISKQGNYEQRLSREFGSRLHRRSMWD